MKSENLFLLEMTHILNRAYLTGADDIILSKDCSGSCQVDYLVHGEDDAGSVTVPLNANDYKMLTSGILDNSGSCVEIMDSAALGALVRFWSVETSGDGLDVYNEGILWELLVVKESLLTDGNMLIRIINRKDSDEISSFHSISEYNPDSALNRLNDWLE